MKRSSPDDMALLSVNRRRTADEDRALAAACQRVLADYRRAVSRGTPDRALMTRARRALRHLGGDPARVTTTLRDYDHVRYGPFLGVSDEGSAAGAIRRAAYGSPKVKALPAGVRATPLVVGVALDAERLGGVGEVIVGPHEYVDVWLKCVDRLLITTNIGTRVNSRVYRREPVVVLKSVSRRSLREARDGIAAAFRPFVETPDGRPRPLTVFVEIPRYAKVSPRRKRAALRTLASFVASGRAAGRGGRGAPDGQRLGLAAWVGLGRDGMQEVLRAIDLAQSAGMAVVLVDGVKRKRADRAVSLAGLLDYFPPGVVGPILRAAAARRVAVRAANLPDTDTIARSAWVGLTTARSFGANLGKYGCFPLTKSETDLVVGELQRWFSDWAAAPVFFVDQGLLQETSVDVGHDVMRGLRTWLKVVAAHQVRVVLIDTIDKAAGGHLLKRDAEDRAGFLGARQVASVEALARRLGIKVLWAGGLGLREIFRLGELGVFGVYVTTATATTIPVARGYVRDPSLAGVKEPTRDGVFRAKVLLEAGFLSRRLRGDLAVRIRALATGLLDAHDRADQAIVRRVCAELASACREGWREHWQPSRGERSRPRRATVRGR